MSQPTPKRPYPPAPVLASGSHGRLYIFAVVSLAVFLLAVALWRNPAESHTARIVLKQTGHHAELNEKSAILQAILDAHLNHAGDGHCAADDGHEHDDAESDGHMGVEHAHSTGQQPHLLVDVNEQGEEKTVTIWCAAPAADAVLDEATHLAQQYVARVAERSDNRECAACRKSQSAVKDAVEALRLAQDNLKAFENAHADELAPPADMSPPQEENAPATTDDEDLAAESNLAAPNDRRQAAGAPPNPEWMELNERLDVLRAAREELLAKKTAAHPQVRDLQWQIEKLEAELALVPQSLASPDVGAEHADASPQNDAIPETPQAHLAIDPPQTASKEPAPELLAHRAKLTAAVDAARQRCKDARAAQKKARREDAAEPAATAEIVEPARIVAVRGGGASRAGAMGGGILALLLGALIAWRSRVLREPSAVVSTGQLESLGLGVVAALPTRDGPALPAPLASNPAWIGWLTFGCELALAAIAAMMCLLALSDWQMAAQLVHDPLSTLGEALSRVW